MSKPDLERSLTKLHQSELFTKRATFRNGMDAQDILLSFADHLEYSLSKDPYSATMRDLWQSLAFTTRDRLADRWIRTQREYYERNKGKCIEKCPAGAVTEVTFGM